MRQLNRQEAGKECCFQLACQSESHIQVGGLYKQLQYTQTEWEERARDTHCLYGRESRREQRDCVPHNRQVQLLMLHQSSGQFSTHEQDPEILKLLSFGSTLLSTHGAIYNFCGLGQALACVKGYDLMKPTEPSQMQIVKTQFWGSQIQPDTLTLAVPWDTIYEYHKQNQERQPRQNPTPTENVCDLVLRT